MTHAEVDKPTTPNVANLVSPAEAAKVISFLLPVFAGLSITGQFSWLTAINAALGILGAVAIFHASANPYVKGGVAVLVAGLQALALVVTDATGLSGVSVQDWWAVVGAALGAVGVVYVPNKIVAAPLVNNVYNVSSLPEDAASEKVLPGNPSETPLVSDAAPVPPEEDADSPRV